MVRRGTGLSSWHCLPSNLRPKHTPISWGLQGREQSLLCVGMGEPMMGTGELAAHRDTSALVIEYPWPEQVVTVKTTSQPYIKSFRCVACKTR